MTEEINSAIDGFMQLLQYQNNYPARGTGSVILTNQAHNLLGPKIPEVMVQYTADYQINLFGGYPSHVDKAPSIIFAAVFGVLMVLHAVIFVVNTSRGHYFWLSIGWVFYCMMRVIGWVLRVIWGADITRTQLGIANEVFLILPTIFLVSFNLVLAQRIFTWRHPVGGSRKLFWSIMISLYVIVTGLVVMTIVASAGPYVYFLSESNYLNYKRSVEATSIFVVLYSCTSIALLGLAFLFKPTSKDENLYTYQPWWIESFAPSYFVKKGAAREAEDTFMKRNHNHRYAIRVIAATHHHHNMVEGISKDRGNLQHNVSMVIICITTILILVGAICRTVAVFQNRYNKDAGPICKPVAMYICWGLFEVIINALYIIGRVDLRFYRPDRLPKKVRAIITAEQSVNISDAEEEEELGAHTPEGELTDELADDYKSTTHTNSDDALFENRPPVYDDEKTKAAAKKEDTDFHF